MTGHFRVQMNRDELSRLFARSSAIFARNSASLMTPFSMSNFAHASVWAKFAINLAAFIESHAAKCYQAAQMSQRRGARNIDEQRRTYSTLQRGD